MFEHAIVYVSPRRQHPDLGLCVGAPCKKAEQPCAAAGAAKPEQLHGRSHVPGPGVARPVPFRKAHGRASCMAALCPCWGLCGTFRATDRMLLHHSRLVGAQWNEGVAGAAFGDPSQGRPPPRSHPCLPRSLEPPRLACHAHTQTFLTQHDGAFSLLPAAAARGPCPGCRPCPW